MINITLALSPDRTAQENAEYAAAFFDHLASLGHYQQKKDSDKKLIPSDKGLWEMKFLETRGLQRMLVPRTWDGTREEYAKSQLDSAVEEKIPDTENNSSSPSLEVFFD